MVLFPVFSKMYLNLRVLIMSRGFIRLLQLIMAVISMATTATFETMATFDIRCRDFEKTTLYKFGYPFWIGKFQIRVPEKCSKIPDIMFKTYTFPYDFSCYAEFYVATGVLTVVYTSGILFVYVFMHRFYSANRIMAVVDLIATGVLSIFWLAGSFAWTYKVLDIIYYSNPANLFEEINICREPKQCVVLSRGNIDSLIVSLAFGFASCMLWICSLWFVYKEASSHAKIQPPEKLPQIVEEEAPPLPEKDIKHVADA